jgi:hypothetical protein
VCDKTKSRDIQRKVNNILLQLQQYFAITMRDIVRKSLRSRSAPPYPTEEAIHFPSHNLRPQMLIACVPPSAPYRLFA